MKSNHFIDATLLRECLRVTYDEVTGRVGQQPFSIADDFSDVVQRCILSIQPIEVVLYHTL